MRSLDLPLINCEIQLHFPRAKECKIYEILNNNEVPANPAADPSFTHVPEGFTTGATFQINSAKLYVSIVTLSRSNNIKFLENLKKGL